MFWVDTVETNIDRLRRYAALACGCTRTGDEAVRETFEPILNDVVFADPHNLVDLFRRLDETLRRQPPVHADTFTEFGRWQFMSTDERRFALLYALEGFSRREAAHITGTTLSDLCQMLKRVRMKYADRFPARIGIAGGTEAQRATLADQQAPFGVHLAWGIGTDVQEAPGKLAAPALILALGGPDEVALKHVADPVQWAVHRAGPRGRDVLDGDFAGPVLVAGPYAMPKRLTMHLWTIPEAGLANPVGLRDMLVKALLFSA